MQQNALHNEKVDVTEAIDAAPFGKFHMLVMFLCGLIAMLDGFDTQSIAFVAPVLIQEWSLQTEVFGSIFAAGLFGLMIGQFCTGPISDRFGRRKVILISTFVFGFFTLISVNADSVTELLILRFLTGLGLGGAMPNIIALTSEYAPKRLRATMVTVMFGGFPLGAVIGGYVSSFLIPAFGWQSVFYLGGAMPLVLLLPLFWLLPESIHHLAISNKHSDDIHKIAARLNPQITHSSNTSYVLNESPLKGLSFKYLFLQDRANKTLLLWVSYFMSLLMIYFLMSWLPLTLKQSGLTLDTAIKSAVYLNLGGMLGGIVLGRFVDRFDPFIVLASSYALAGSSISLIGFVEAPNVLMFVVFLAGFFIIGAQTAMNAVVTDVYPAQIRSTGLGTALSVGRMGSIVGPVVGGMLLAASWQMENIFIASATPAFLACVALLFLKKVMSQSRA